VDSGNPWGVGFQPDADILSKIGHTIYWGRHTHTRRPAREDRAAFLASTSAGREGLRATYLHNIASLSVRGYVDEIFCIVREECNAMSQAKLPARTYSTDLERIVSRTALIENLLNQVVTNYCAPREDLYHFFWDVLLDSSVMPTGSKVKVAMAISQKVKRKLDRNALHKVLSLRNSFAHHGLESHPVLELGRSPGEGSVRYELQVLDNEGRLTRTERASAVEQFDVAYESARESLKTLLEAIKIQQSGDVA
jgi:hypothetical protein